MEISGLISIDGGWENSIEIINGVDIDIETLVPGWKRYFRAIQ